MFISKNKISTLSTSGNNKERTVIRNDSSDVEMKNNNSNNNDATTSKKLDSIKMTKSKIFSDQQTKLKN